ncbi:MAG: GNAT family N-acetyltransferase [Thermoflexales bacterium]|nr:GNAT family N-acetyltransferase [Thermoflexales bacterium]
MHLHVYDSPAAFDVLAAEWDGLLARSHHDTLFLTCAWQHTWWSALGEGEMRVVAMRKGGQLVGIAPLFFSEDAHGRRVGAFIGCKEVSDYLDFIVARGHEVEVLRSVADFLKSADCPSWHALNLCNIREGSPTLTLFFELIQAEGWQPQVVFEDVCPVLTLPSSFGEYLMMLDGKERRELQRKLRRASENVAITFADSAERLDRDVEDFIRLMTASTPQKAAFMTPQMARFFHAIARAMFDRGRLQLAFLEVEGVRAATYLNFTYRDAVLVYNSGLDLQRFAYLSPGQVLLVRLIERAIAEGFRVFDFLQGGEDYKYKLGGKDVRLFTLLAQRA